MISALLRKRDSSTLLHFFSTVAPQLASKHLSTYRNDEFSPAALFLKNKGFSDTQLDIVFSKRKRLRSANVEGTLKPKIEILENFGFSVDDITYIITKFPDFLHHSLNNRIHPALSLLQNMLGSGGAVVQLLRKSTHFFRTDSMKTVFPNTQLLESIGLSKESMLRLLCLCPATFLNKPETIRKHVQKLGTLGMDPSSGMFIYGLWAVASMSNQVWDLKLRTLMDLGFTQSEALSIFRKEPQAFIATPEKIKGIVEAVLSTKIYTLASIIAFPCCFLCSIEKRLKPRLQMLRILDQKKLLDKWPSLSSAIKHTDKKFHEKFIAPYPTIFTGNTSLLVAKNKSRNIGKSV